MRKHSLALLFLFFLIVLFFSKGIFSRDHIFAPVDTIYLFSPWNGYKQEIPQNFQQADALYQFIPWRLYAYNQIHKGNFPLWNPYEYGGIPFFANDQSGAMSFFNIIGLPFSFDKGFLLIDILKLLVSAIGMYIFLNIFSLSTASCIIGSIAYTFSALLITWLYHPLSMVTPFIPWLFWAFERLYQSVLEEAKATTIIPLSIASIIVALSFFSGHSETTANALFGIIIYCTTKIAIQHKKIILSMFMLVSSIMLGFLLAAVHTLPFLQLLLNSVPFYNRSLLPLSTGYTKIYLPLYSLIVWLVPNIMGNPSFSYFWMNLVTGLHEAVPYIGIAPLLLGILTLIHIKSDYKRLLPFWIMVFFGLGMAYGIPVIKWLTMLPLIRAGGAFRYIILMEFGLAALSAFGLEMLIKHKPKHADKCRPIIEPDKTMPNMVIPAKAGIQNKKNCPPKADQPLAEIPHQVRNDKKGIFNTGINANALLILLTICSLSLILYLITRYNIGLAAAPLGHIELSGHLSWLNSQTLAFVFIQIILSILFISGTLWFVVKAYKKQIYGWIIPAGLITLSIMDLFIFGIGYNPNVPAKDFYPDSPIISKLKTLDTKDYSFYAYGSIIPPDTAMAYHLRDFRGYDMIASIKYQNLLYLIFPEEHPNIGEMGLMYWPEKPSPVIAGITGIKYFVFPKSFNPNNKYSDNYSNHYFKLIDTYKDLSLWDNSLALPMYYLVHQIITTYDDYAALQLLSKATFENLKTPVVQGISDRHIYKPEQVKLTETGQKPGEHVFDVRAGSDGFLVLNEPFYPGWHAYINEKPVTIYHTNYLFQGIELPKGSYTARIEYEPGTFYIGLKISITVAIIMSVIIIGIVLLNIIRPKNAF